MVNLRKEDVKWLLRTIISAWEVHENMKNAAGGTDDRKRRLDQLFEVYELSPKNEDTKS